MSRRAAGFMSGAGLFAGATAWALHQQAAYITASWSCGTNAAPRIWLSSVAGLVVLLAGLFLSVVALRRRGLPEKVRPRRFLAVIGILGALLFLFALVLQAAAAFFLPGCIG